MEGQEEPSAELSAFYREAAEALSGGDDGSPYAAIDLTKDPDRAAAVLASIYSGTETQAERGAFELAAAHSTALRLDAEAALAFVDRVEEAREQAPAHLISALSPSASQPARDFQGFSSTWFGGRWRIAAVCTVLLAAAGTTWSLLDQPSQSRLRSDGGAAGPTVKAESREPATRPVEPALASVPPCAPATAATAAAVDADPAKAERPADRSANGDCSPVPGSNPVAASPAELDHQLADKTPEEIEAIAAVRRAEAARQAEAIRRAESAASKFGATQSGAAASRPAGDPGSSFGAQRPAATPARPSAIDRPR
ncbi:MAG: hypothetical protein WA418_16780 [Bradyrhizobium sp.]